MQPVPDFFQSETPSARRAQVDWLEKHLELTDDFFAKVLHVDSALVRGWRGEYGRLDPGQQERLGSLWNLFLHLFSLLNFEYSRVKDLLEAEAAPALPFPVLAAELPWAGRSMRWYLEHCGESAINDITRWVTSLRFTDRYPAKSAQPQWPSPTALQ